MTISTVAIGDGGTSPEASVRIHAKTFIVLLAINLAYIAQLVGVVGSGFLAQPITTLFGVPTDAVWLSSGITIMTVVLSPIFTQASDYWGRKWLICCATTFGFVGAIIVSRAESMGTVIAGFTIMGVCYGAQPLLHTVASEILARKHRPLAQAAINFSAGSGVVIGICIGGSLLRNGNLENFRNYMYIVAGIFAAATLAVVVCYNPPLRELQTSLTLREKLQRLDWLGYILFIPGLVLFCVGLAYYQNPYSFKNAHVLALFLIGIAFAIGFGIYEWIQKHGVLDHDLFHNRNYPLTLLCVFVEGLAFFAANSYYVFETAVFTRNDILISALHFALIPIVANVACIFAGIYAAKMKKLRSTIVTGFVLFLLFFVALAVTTPSSPTAVFWGLPVLAGVGMGVLLPNLIVTAQLSTPSGMISPASGLLISIRSLGGAVGLAVNNALFNSALASEIPSKIAAAVIPLGFPASDLAQLIPAVASSNQTALATIPGASPDIIAAAQRGLASAYGIGFRNAWIAAACFCTVAVVGSCFLIDPRSEFTGHIDAPAEAMVVQEQERKEGKQRQDQERAEEKQHADGCVSHEKEYA